MPRLTKFRVTIDSPRISPFTSGNSRSVSTVALPMNAR